MEFSPMPRKPLFRLNIHPVFHAQATPLSPFVSQKSGIPYKRAPLSVRSKGMRRAPEGCPGKRRSGNACGSGPIASLREALIRSATQSELPLNWGIYAPKEIPLGDAPKVSIPLVGKVPSGDKGA